MNYAVDSCMSAFTPGQAARVRDGGAVQTQLCANMPSGVCRGVALGAEEETVIALRPAF